MHPNQQLRSAATDCGCNIAGKMSGTVERFEREIRTGFYCICCAANQLNLITQNIVTRLWPEELQRVALIVNV